MKLCPRCRSVLAAGALGCSLCLGIVEFAEAARVLDAHVTYHGLDQMLDSHVGESTATAVTADTLITPPAGRMVLTGYPPTVVQQPSPWVRGPALAAPDV
jgi:hypothetical protein